MIKKIFGKKTMHPTIIEVSMDISTAAAATSLVSRAKRLYCGELKSISISMAELNTSETNTKPMEKIKTIHSRLETFKKNPKTITTIIENISKNKCLVVIIKTCMPLNAFKNRLLTLISCQAFISFLESIRLSYCYSNFISNGYMPIPQAP